MKVYIQKDGKENESIQRCVEIAFAVADRGGGRVFCLYGVSGMTKTELKVILKLIDLHTIVRELGYYGTEERKITESGIKRLKDDITELYGGENETEDTEKV